MTANPPRIRAGLTGIVDASGERWRVVRTLDGGACSFVGVAMERSGP
jgi:hypothetical protein